MGKSALITMVVAAMAAATLAGLMGGYAIGHHAGSVQTHSHRVVSQIVGNDPFLRDRFLEKVSLPWRGDLREPTGMDRWLGNAAAYDAWTRNIRLAVSSGEPPPGMHVK